MKKSAIRFGAIGLSVLTAASLVACSGSGGSADTPKPSASAGEVSGTVTFPSFFWADAGTEWQKSWVDTFKGAFPDVEVTQTPIPFADYHNKMYTDMASGQAADLVTPYDPQIGQWIREGLLEPLDDCLASHDIDTSTLIPAQELAIVDGKTYGIPLYTNPRVLVYNKQLFEQAGVSQPKDLKEFKKAISGATDSSTQQFGFGTVTGSDSPAATYLEIMPIIAGFGGAFVTDGKATADSDEVAEALSFIDELYDDGEIPQGQTQSAYREAFAAGKVASAAIGGFIFNVVKGKNPAVGEQLDAVPLPLPTGETVAVTVYLSIPAGAKNKDAACELLATSFDPELQATTSSMLTAIPATGEVDQAFLDENPYFQAVVDAADTAVSYAPQGAEEHMAEVTQTITDVYQEMLTTPMTGEEASKEIQSQLEALLKD